MAVVSEERSGSDLKRMKDRLERKCNVVVIDLANRLQPLRASLGGIILGIAMAGPAAADTLELKLRDEQGKALEHVAVALVPLVGAVMEMPRRAEIVQKDKRFIPLMSAVQTGSAVDFPNRDTVRHHVYSFSPAKTFELKLYLGQHAAPVVFDKPGVVVMGCNIHDQMVAYVMVADTPWLGVSDAEGQVRLSGFPAGEYRLEYWHPRWAGRTEVASKRIRVAGDESRTLTIGAQP